MSDPFQLLAAPFHDRTATIAIIGMGYVGLPLAEIMVHCGFSVIGIDIDTHKIDALNAGKSYLHHIGDERIRRMLATGKFRATHDFSALKEAHAILICVPTPISASHEPVLDHVIDAAHAIRDHLRRGQLVVLESSVFPGATTGVLKPVLEASGMWSGEDFFLAFSPEREDPGNAQFTASNICKVLSGDGAVALKLAEALYSQCVTHMVFAPRPEIAEASKLLENTFRAVNIGLINELKTVFDAMGIDIWEVIEVAKSKPFGFMPFYPGPGVGGHCIPIDPLYLAWKAREHHLETNFIVLADRVNAGMPAFVVHKLIHALHEHFSCPLEGAQILLLGVAYKKNIGDCRESPAFAVAGLLAEHGAGVAYFDPIVHEITNEYALKALAGQRSIALQPEVIKKFAAAIIITDHDDVDYQMLADHCPLIIDTRNATKDLKPSKASIIKA